MIRQGLLIFADGADGAAQARRRFGGLTLLDRGVRTLIRAGVSHVVVLMPQDAPARVSRLPRKLRAPVQIARWGEPLELPVGKGGVAVLMGDYAHHHTGLTELVGAGLVDSDMVVHAGPAPDQTVPFHGVEISDHRLEIGPGSDTVSSGAFLCSDTVAVSELSTSGLALPAFLSQRSEGLRVSAFSAAPDLWRRATDWRSGRQAANMLFSHVTKKTSGPISRHLNARISIPTSKVLVETGISPHLVTVFFVLTTGLASAYFTSDPTSYARLAVAGLLWQLAAILDRCDGEIARVKLSESKFGAWFDTVTDNFAYLCAFVAIVVGMTRLHPRETLYIYVAVSGVSAMLLSLVLLYTYAARTGSGSLQNYLVGFRQHVPAHEKGPVYRFMERYAFLAKRDSWSFVMCLLALAGFFEVIYWFLMGGLHLIAAAVLLSRHKMLAGHPDMGANGAPDQSALEPAPASAEESR